MTAMLASGASAHTINYSNNPAPGDDVTYSVTGASVPVGSSRWIYHNVRYKGHAGIRTDLPRSGNGSVWFKGEPGIGSGWGTFEGAVDNISYKFGSGPLVTTNFEVVPEPATMALFGLGLAAVGGFARRKRA